MLLKIVVGLCCLVLGYKGMDWWMSSRLQRRLFQFLGVKQLSQILMSQGASRDTFFEVDLRRALRDCLPALGLKTEVIGLQGAQLGIFSPPGSDFSLPNLLGGLCDGGTLATRPFLVGPDQNESFPTPALHLVSGGPFPVLLYPWIPQAIIGAGPEIHLAAATVNEPEAQAWIQGLLEQIDTWMRENSVFRGQLLMLDTEGNMSLKFVPQIDTAPVTLDDEIRNELDANFVTFLKETALFEAAGIPSKRGLLLCGEPGTGKTTTCRYLKQELPDHAVILADSTSTYYFRRLFEIARKVEPSILVLEDVDLLLPTRETTVISGPLRDLLNEMDGTQKNGRLSVVMTSNSWQFLDVALAERPGRIDHVVLFEKPGPPHRRVLLEKLMQRCSWDLDFDSLVRAADGFTPAQLTEMVKKAMIKAIERIGLKEGRAITLEMEDFRLAIDLVQSGGLPTKLKRRIGLKQLTT